MPFLRTSVEIDLDGSFFGLSERRCPMPSSNVKVRDASHIGLEPENGLSAPPRAQDFQDHHVTERRRSQGLCVRCGCLLPPGSTRRRQYCGAACRQAAARERREARAMTDAMRFLAMI